ncbi:MAG: LptE family protein [Verrucomicrobiota bacterium]
MMKKFAFLLPVLALLLGGCAGYHVGPIQPKIMEGIKSISVPSFKNKTLIPRLEVLTADIVIRQIQQDGTYQIASNDTADAVIEGTILSVSRNGLRSLRENVLTTTEFNVTVMIRYRLVRRSTGEEIESRSVSGSTSFYTGEDPNEGERQAIPLAIQNAAVRLVSQISEGW